MATKQAAGTEFGNRIAASAAIFSTDLLFLRIDFAGDRHLFIVRPTRHRLLDPGHGSSILCNVSGNLQAIPQ
jgi:hypothetical protein